MENPHPAQESLRETVGAFPEILRFTADAQREGLGCETICLFGSGGGWRARVAGARPAPAATRHLWRS